MPNGKSRSASLQLTPFYAFITGGKSGVLGFAPLWERSVTKVSPVGVFPGSKCIPAGLPQCPLASRAVQHLGNPSDCVLPMISCCRGMCRTFPVRSDGQISLPFPSLSLRRCPSYAAGKQSRRAALRRACQELGPQPGASLCLLKVTQSGISRACPWPCEVCFVRAVWCWSCPSLWGSLLAPVAPRCLRALRSTLLPAQSPSRGKPCAVSWEVLGGWLLLFLVPVSSYLA